MASSKTIIVVAIVVIVVIAAVAAFFLINNNKNSDPEPVDFSPTTRLLIYGNANNDDYLDKSDVNYIQDIIDKKVTWNKTKYPLADTNGDGQVTSADITLLNKILKGESATVYYMNWYGEKKSIHYPLSGNIAGCYVQVADVCIIAGCYNDIIGMKDTQENLNKLDSTLYPGAATKWKSLRGDTNVFDVQKCLANNVNVVLSDPFALTESFVSGMKSGNPNVNIIELPINRAVGDVDWTHTVITLGAMYNNQSATKKYTEFVQDVEKDIKSKLAKVKEKYPDQTFLICYEPSNATTTNLDIFGQGKVQYGDVTNMARLPLTCALSPQQESGYITDYPIEKVITMNPTVICVESWGKINTMTEAEYEAAMAQMVSYFTKTGAYQNNKVISFAYEVYGTVPGIAGMIYMGYLIWPDLFDKQDGIDYLNQYYRNFTNLGKDFDVTKHTGYLPELWGASIN